MAQIVKSIGLNPVLDLHIESISSDIAREIDVCFDVTDESSDHRVRFLIECKYTQSPWIVLHGFEKPFGAFELDGFCRTKNAKSFWTTGEEFTRNEKHLIDNDYFGSTILTGNSIHEPTKKKPDRRDIPYKTLKKITLSAQDMIAKFDEIDTGLQATCIPCVVIDNDLFQARWNDKINDFTIHPITMARLSWMGTGKRRSVLISTLDNAESFCRTLMNMGNCINAINHGI
ncbi:MAG: hypothetical protein JKX70_03045 [Phycisphaerales bacterium]|nr:hypothetical protein [Phycisphaerales bacterium]